jgi:hypothetical protein
LLDLGELDHDFLRSSHCVVFHLITFPSTIHLAAGAFTGFVLAVPPNRAALAFAAMACIFSTFAARALAFLTLASLAADMSFPFAIACARGFSFQRTGLNEQKRDLDGQSWFVGCFGHLGDFVSENLRFMTTPLTGEEEQL